MYAHASLVQAFRNTAIGKFLSISIALYVFNVSIDSVDPSTLDGKENLSINDIESFVELIIEDVCNGEDFFSRG